jgi:hypothetical protein
MRSTALERDEHGPTAYRAGCRCRRCRSATSIYKRERRAELAVLNGRAPQYWCSTRPMLAHIAALQAAGWTRKAIAEAAGLNVNTFRDGLREGRTSSRTVVRVLDVG